MVTDMLHCVRKSIKVRTQEDVDTSALMRGQGKVIAGRGEKHATSPDPRAAD